MKEKIRRLAVLALLAVCSTIAMAQSKVTGNVVDANGEPIIGATIKVKGSSAGTISDINGNFSIQAAKGAVLEVSYVGYTPQSIKVSGSAMKVTLQEDATALQEVVVVGYGTMRKKDLTGSVVQIDPDKIADQNPASVQDLLRGTPGLQIGFDASAKGSGASIQLRGQNSLYTDGSHNSPLIILDGMQFAGELSEINPDDIEQIDVLKDASSAAIYGAKAASGVIIITTRKGKEGKPVINVSVNLAANTKAAYPDMFGPDAYMKYREDWYKAQTYGYREDGSWGYYGKDSGIPQGYYDHYNNISQYGISQDQWASTGPKTQAAGESMLSLYARRMGFDADAALVMENFLAGKTYDWADATFRTGFNRDYNANISGATDKVNYYLGVGYLKKEGAIQGDDYDAIRANMKINAHITDWLEMGANVNFQDRSDTSSPVPLGANYWDNNQLRESPYASRYDADGNEIQYPRTGNPTNGGYNYHFDQQYIDLEKGYTVLNTIFNAKVKLPFGITYQFNVAPRLQWFYDRYWMSASLPDSKAADRGANRNSAKTYNWNLNNTITWDRTFADHHVTVTLVQEAEENRYWSDNISARNITPTDVLGFHYIAGANKEQSSFSTNDTHYTAAAYLGRLFYGYKDRYMVTATLRRDGYSAFGENNPWANFWSLGGSWVLSEESFAKDLKWLDMAKLRVSYGTNGNRSLSNTYLSLSNLTNGGLYAYYKYGSLSQEVLNALRVDRLGNPNLEWEKTSSWNFGLDFSVLNRRISGSLEFYHKKTHDMIMAQRLPNFTGFSSITTNLGEVTNTGVEITINTRNIDTPDFTWNTSIGFSYNKNRIKHLYYEYDETGKEMDDTSNGWFIDKPIGEIWYWETDGIWQANEAEQAALVNQKPGDPKVINHYTDDDKILDDGTRVPVYNDKDRQYLGTTQPPVYWNMRNDFTFLKDFTFSFSLYSYMGHKSLSSYWLNSDNSGSMFTQTCNTMEKEYWTPENPTNEYGRLNAVGPSGVTGIQKLHNRSFVRLDNITLGYTLPKALTNKVGIQRVHVSAGINNVFTIDSWEYGDPETGGFANRQFQFGLKVTL